MRHFIVLFLLVLGVPSLSLAGIKVGLVLDKGGRSDKGFNAAAAEGMERITKALQLQGDAREASGDGGHEALLRQFAQEKYDLVIALGEPRAAAVKKVAAEFPAVKFAIVDAEVVAPNVRSILFREQEGSYLVGAIAALTTKTGKLGFIGGMDIPVIRRYEAGFEAGAKSVNPKIALFRDFIGTTGAAWMDKDGAKKLALAQYAKGADVIFAVSGGANLGVFDAASDKNAFAIGVSNQNGLKPGHVLTSMRKRVDIGVFMTVQDAALGGFTGEVKRYGISDRAVDFVVDDNNDKLIPKKVLDRVSKLSDRVAEGKIAVPEAPKR